MFLNTLPTNARQLLTQLGQEPEVRPFYLAGGSAAALHLGHRTSVDLDFFTSESHYEPEPLVQRLQDYGHLIVEQQSRGTLVGSLSSVRISFFVYPYPLLAKPTELDGIPIADLLDLGMMKLIAVSQRGTKRDFVDLYFICQHGYSLDDLLARLFDKYPTSYPINHLIRALVYFEDAELDAPPQMLVPYDWDQIKQFFQDEGERLMQQLYTN